jgi:hypothetical protein
MKILNDFQCAKGHKEEYFVDRAVKTVTCRHCGNEATRLIATPRISLDGCSGDFPTASDAWIKRRESHMKWEQKTGRVDPSG